MQRNLSHEVTSSSSVTSPSSVLSSLVSAHEEGEETDDSSKIRNRLLDVAIDRKRSEIQREEMEVSSNDGSSFKEADLDLYTIPSQSSWFVWEDIHEIERREFVEFFSETSITRTPKVYKEYRDFIINKYREDTSRRLTFTSIRKHLVGDVNLLRKVFLFLENWGLINFLLKESDDYEEESEVKIEHGTPSGIRVTATPVSMRPVTLPPHVEERAEPAFKFSPLTSYSDVFADFKKPLLVCGRCGERPFYQHTKSVVTLCDKCFKNGDYGENNSADDFKLIGSSGTADWTEEETLLLLESVLKHGDDWELIAQSVSTKTRLDCISKLIELPFGEFLMGSASGRLRSSIPTSEDGNLSSPSNVVERMKADGQEQKETETREEKEEDRVVDEDEPPAKRKHVAMLSDGDCSLLKQVAAMACKVGPSVTAAAAKAAIAALCDEASCPKDIFETTGDSAVYRADGDKDTSDMEEQQEDKGTQEDLPVGLRMRASVATALGAAAAHAKILADQEEREMEQLAASIIDQQLKKMKSKLKFLDHLELIMDAEEQVMEGVKETILQERISVLQCAFGDGITKRWDNMYVK
ncbi:SWI/SNF complex subunit SWI3A isoform X2 [Raphanus sativus]|uniref:SWI/SNF complex subunit SWI3A isoform X2 n=1 Tax=Raphanus sativus TaxID=3726 RepID=A0A9W3DFL3_RAPSA|nr:SWI/SNF complex subunit SWI3A isoform X2 [Raphanus sativus]